MNKVVILLFLVSYKLILSFIFIEIQDLRFLELSKTLPKSWIHRKKLEVA